MTCKGAGVLFALDDKAGFVGGVVLPSKRCRFRVIEIGLDAGLGLCGRSHRQALSKKLIVDIVFFI